MKDNKNIATAPIVTVKDWIITYLILMIPFVGLIMSIVWAIKANNPSKRNLFIAYWIITGIFIGVILVIYIILLFVYGSQINDVIAGSGQVHL